MRADTSFGPPREQFRSVQGVAVYLGDHLLLWTSSRQPFVTLSTAESELLAYTEALQCTESVSKLLKVMNLDFNKILEGDSKAALCQIQNDGGSWRTRHLRLRAWKLREVMSDVTSNWLSVHRAGCDLVADGLTKALNGQAHRNFLHLLGMKDGNQNEEVIAAKKIKTMERDHQQLWQHLATASASAGSALLLGSDHKTLELSFLFFHWL